MKKTYFYLLLGGILSASSTSFGQFDMGGGPPPKQEGEVGTRDDYSKTQKKYQNTVVFSSSFIEKNNENPSTFKGEFNLGDPIYYRFYYDETLEKKGNTYIKKKTDEIFNTTYHDYVIGYIVSINGKEVAKYGREFSKDPFILNYVSGSGRVFDPNEEEKYYGSLSVAIKRVFLALSDDFKPGTYNIEIKAYAFPTEADVSFDKSKRIVPMFEGKLKINATEDGIKKYIPALCKLVKKPSNAMDDDQLERDIKTSFNKNFPKYKAELVYLLNEEWNIFKDGLGRLKYKTIYSQVIYKDENGKTQWGEYVVKRNYDGGSYSGLINFGLDEEEPMCPQCVEWYNNQ